MLGVFESEGCRIEDRNQEWVREERATYEGQNSQEESKHRQAW